DMLIAYDTSMLKIQSVTSALTDYEIFKFDRRNHMTITGIKNFQKRDPVTFNDVVIMEVVDRKSTRLNSSHVKNSYAVFCLIQQGIEQRYADVIHRLNWVSAGNRSSITYPAYPPDSFFVHLLASCLT